MATKEPKASNAPAVINPIETLHSDIARVYTHLHPAIVLTVFIGRFAATVEDPITSLVTVLPVLCILQGIYCIICVPLPSSSTNAPAATSITQSKSQSQAGRKKTSRTTNVLIASKITPAVLSTILSLFAATPVLTILLILHGAPLTTHIQYTVLAAAHFAILSALPLFYAHGVGGAKWRTLVSLSAPVDELLGAAIGVFVGAWVGAIPIPLDWDREWQKWPITVVAGGYGGWAIGKILGGTLFKGKSVRFDD